MALKMSLKVTVIEMLTAELEGRQMLAIYLMDSGREMTENVTKSDLTGIIHYLCQRLGWTETSDGGLSSVAPQTVIVPNEVKVLEKDVIESVETVDLTTDVYEVVDNSGAYTPEPDYHEEVGRVFHCMSCDKVFGSQNDFVMHQSLHDQAAQNVQEDEQNEVDKSMTDCDDLMKPYQCNGCKERFDRFIDVNAHTCTVKEEHPLDNTLHCSICDKMFVSESELKIHNSLHEQAKQRIQECEILVKSQQEAIKKKVMAFKCNQCPKIFITELDLQKHKTLHFAASNLVQESELLLNLKHDLQNSKASNQKNEHPINQNEDLKDRHERDIEAIEESNANESKTVEETQVVDNQNYIPCQSDEAMEYEEEAQTTELKAHKIDSSIPKEVGQFSCSKCGKTFNRKITLQAHNESNQKILSCCKCNRVFLNRKFFDAHEKWHATNLHGDTTHIQSQASYSCKQCYKTFTTMAKLKKHESHHTLVAEKLEQQKINVIKQLLEHKTNESETIQIDDNDVESTKSQEIQKNYNGNNLKHKLVNHKLFNCTNCYKSFSSEAALKKHETLHSLAANMIKKLGQNFDCKTCSSSFQTKASLERHENVFHS